MTDPRPVHLRTKITRAELQALPLDMLRKRERSLSNNLRRATYDQNMAARIINEVYPALELTVDELAARKAKV